MLADMLSPVIFHMEVHSWLLTFLEKHKNENWNTLHFSSLLFRLALRESSTTVISSPAGPAGQGTPKLSQMTAHWQIRMQLAHNIHNIRRMCRNQTLSWLSPEAAVLHLSINTTHSDRPQAPLLIINWKLEIKSFSSCLLALECCVITALPIASTTKWAANVLDRR